MIEPERDAPDLEDLAAYLDGRLSDELKARVEDRLARDEEYYEVFVENVRFQQEEQSRQQREGGGGEVVAPAVWWRSRRVAAAAAGPAAAAGALVAAIGLPQLMHGPSTEAWVAQLDARAVIGSGDDWDVQEWSTLRGDPGVEDPDLERRRQLAFRIGTHTVDLTVALAAGNRDAAGRHAARLEKRTEHLSLARYYAELQGRIEAEPIDALRAQAADLEAALKEALAGTVARRYALGRWNEAGRLAALAGDAEVLRGLYPWRRLARGIEEIEPDLERLEKALEPQSPDFAAAKDAFSEIADKLAGRG